MLRGSYGEGFLPPAVDQLVPNPASIFMGADLGFTADPRRGNEALGSVIFTFGGNTNLRPEESKSWSTGFVLSPQVLPGFRLSLDWTRINKTDNIVTLPFDNTLLLSESLFPGRVTRETAAVGDPYGVGRITNIDITLVNIARAEVAAYDLAVDYRLQTSTIGALDFFALATRQTHYKTQLLGNLPIVENVGVGETFGSIPLKFKSNAGVTWRRDRWTLGWTARYFNSYLVSRTAATRQRQGNNGKVPSQTFHDLFVMFSTAGTAGYLSDMEIQLGGRNVLNKSPALDFGTSAPNISPFGDPRRATYYISLKKAFGT